MDATSTVPPDILALPAPPDPTLPYTSLVAEILKEITVELYEHIEIQQPVSEETLDRYTCVRSLETRKYHVLRVDRVDHVGLEAGERQSRQLIEARYRGFMASVPLDAARGFDSLAEAISRFSPDA